MADRLSLANALAEAKIERSAAERIATEIVEAIHNSVATKDDIAAIRSDMRSLEQRLDGRIDGLRGEMNLKFTELEHRLATMEYRLVIRLGGILVVLLGLLFAALRYLPPAH